MPAVSEAQRRYLYRKFGPAWMKKHHFDNEGKLPLHVPPKHYRNRSALHGMHKRRKR